VELLLDKGANVNAQGGYYGNALQAASYHGYEAIMKLLLDKGANVNAQGGYFGNALRAASEGGHEAIANLLFDKGVDSHLEQRPMPAPDFSREDDDDDSDVGVVKETFNILARYLRKMFVVDAKKSDQIQKSYLRMNVFRSSSRTSRSAEKRPWCVSEIFKNA